MKNLRQIFGKPTPLFAVGKNAGLDHTPGLICPHCEKAFAEHDEGACKRRMSRRFFFGLVVAPLVAKVALEPEFKTYAVMATIEFELAGTELERVIRTGIWVRETVEMSLADFRKLYPHSVVRALE